jgi:hypothetical protein
MPIDIGICSPVAMAFQGAERVQVRVKSSGLCLEHPGRRGTIRQNRCSPSLPNQEFILTE